MALFRNVKKLRNQPFGLTLDELKILNVPVECAYNLPVSSLIFPSAVEMLVPLWRMTASQVMVPVFFEIGRTKLVFISAVVQRVPLGRVERTDAVIAVSSRRLSIPP